MRRCDEALPRRLRGAELPRTVIGPTAGLQPGPHRFLLRGVQHWCHHSQGGASATRAAPLIVATDNQPGHGEIPGRHVGGARRASATWATLPTSPDTSEVVNTPSPTPASRDTDGMFIGRMGFQSGIKWGHWGLCAERRAPTSGTHNAVGTHNPVNNPDQIVLRPWGPPRDWNERLLRAQHQRHQVNIRQCRRHRSTLRRLMAQAVLTRESREYLEFMRGCNRITSHANDLPPAMRQPIPAITELQNNSTGNRAVAQSRGQHPCTNSGQGNFIYGCLMVTRPAHPFLSDSTMGVMFFMSQRLGSRRSKCTAPASIRCSGRLILHQLLAPQACDDDGQ